MKGYSENISGTSLNNKFIPICLLLKITFRCMQFCKLYSYWIETKSLQSYCLKNPTISYFNQCMLCPCLFKMWFYPYPFFLVFVMSLLVMSVLKHCTWRSLAGKTKESHAIPNFCPWDFATTTGRTWRSQLEPDFVFPSPFSEGEMRDRFR